MKYKTYLAFINTIFLLVLFLSICPSTAIWPQAVFAQETKALYPHTQDMNLILIIIDTLRADRLGCYGYNKIETPAIDSLAKQGFLFSHAYCQVPITLPSHASILTATYPLFHGAKDNGRYILDDNFITLAELLQKKDYQTAAFIGAFPLDSRFGLHQGFELYDDFIGQKGQDEEQLVFAERKAEEVYQSAIKWVKEKGKEKFFLWLHFFDPHSPYSPPEPFKSRYLNSPYDGEIAYVDSVIQALFAELEKSGVDEKTIIVLTSDHGEGLGEHQEDTHGLLLYNSTLHIPLIFKIPHFPNSSVVITQLVRSIDIMPTILDLLNIKPPAKQMQGVSLLPLMLKKKKDYLLSEYSYFETFYSQLNYNWAPLKGIMCSEWKLILGPKPELYNLQNDSEELDNLYQQRKDKAKELLKIIERTIKENSPHPGMKAQQIPLSEEARKKLMSLGYLTSSSKSEGRNINPRDMMGLLREINQAAALYRSQDFAKAISAFRDILKKDPENIEALIYLGSCYQKTNDIDKAIEGFSRALKIDSQNSNILFKLSRCYFNKGDYDRAETGFMEAIKLDKNNNLALFHLGLISYIKGEVRQALSWFERGLKVDEKDIDCRYNLANCLLENRDFSRAIEEYKKVIQLNPNYGDAYNGLGVAYFQKGDIAQSIDNLKKAIQFNPAKVEIYFNLATILETSKRYEEAFTYYQKFLQLAKDPSMKPAIEAAEQAIKRIKGLE